MMEDGGTSGFDAIRAQWTKNAAKFGSPLPGRQQNVATDAATVADQYPKSKGVGDGLVGATPPCGGPPPQRRHSYAPSKLAATSDHSTSSLIGNAISKPPLSSPNKSSRFAKHGSVANSSKFPVSSRGSGGGYGTPDQRCASSLADDVQAFLSQVSQEDLDDPSERIPPARVQSPGRAMSPVRVRSPMQATKTPVIVRASPHAATSRSIGGKPSSPGGTSIGAGHEESSQRTYDDCDVDATETSRTEAGEGSDGSRIREVRRIIIKKKKKKKVPASGAGLSSSSHHTTFTVTEESSNRSSGNDDDFANDLSETSRTEDHGLETNVREVKVKKVKKKKKSTDEPSKTEKKEKKQVSDEEKKSDSSSAAKTNYPTSKPSPTLKPAPTPRPVVGLAKPVPANRRDTSSARQKQGRVFSICAPTGKPKLPHYNHSDQAQDCILQALYNNASLTATRVGELTQLLSAFEPFQYPAGEIIMDEGDTPEYFFVMDSGLVEITIEEQHVRTASAGDSFGELALLYDTRCPITVLALEDCRVFRVDKQSFRTLLAADARRCVQKKLRLLQGIRFLDHLSASELRCISEAMTPRTYKPGDSILDKDDYGSAFYVVADGQVFLGKREGPTFKSGDYFGQEAFVVSQTLSGAYRAATACLAFSFAKQHFDHLLDELSTCILTDKKVRSLSAISCLKDYDAKSLVTHLKEKRFYDKEKIMIEKETTKAALYIIREGSVVLSKGGDIPQRLGVGSCFGEATVEKALEKSRKSVRAPYSVSAEEGCVCAVLFVKDVLAMTSSDDADDDLSKCDKPSHFPIPKLGDLVKHSILGQGAFGQVWLTSDQTKQRAFALKIQSKSFLVEENQVEVVIQEKVMLDNLKHPFLIKLFTTYQDKRFIYFLMEYIQGGELFNLMHSGNGLLPENHALFYTLSLADVLSYLHRGKYVYRENVMIDSRGFVKLIDFGFCKYLIEDKTYTLCGTPGYLAPEVVAQSGHHHGADHWALGVLVFEMLFGSSPFYYDGVEQNKLFLSILDDPVVIPDSSGKLANDFLTRILQKDPAARLGAKNEAEIMNHKWFKDLDANALRNKSITPPWQPSVTGLFDASNFSPDASEIHELDGKPLAERDAKLFEGLF